MAPVDNNSFVSDIKHLIEHSRRTAYAAVNSIMIDTYWHIGQRIVEQEQQGEKRAEYGKQIIKMLSKELTQEYGEGWSERTLWYCKSFFLTFNDIEILHTRVQNLTWSHIRTALCVDDSSVMSRRSTCYVPLPLWFADLGCHFCVLRLNSVDGLIIVDCFRLSVAHGCD